jgi:putative inorganic carbon (HCO3(-)) transporter
MLLALALSGYRRSLCVSLVFVGLIGLVLSGSRGGIIGFAVPCLALTAFVSRLKIKVFLLGVPIILATIALLSTAAVFERPEESISTADSRLALWGGALLAFSQNPAVGVGATNMSPTMGDFTDTGLAHAHNVYLQILAENGLIGFVLFVPALAYLLWHTWKGRENRILLASSLALIVFCVHGLADNILSPENPSCLLLFFTVIGLAASAPSLRSQNSERLSP